jgi:hypothetical protein
MHVSVGERGCCKNGPAKIIVHMKDMAQVKNTNSNYRTSMESPSLKNKYNMVKMCNPLLK